MGSTKSKGIFRVSIVMPCLNEERFIGRAIESLLGSEIASSQERLAMTNMVPDRWPDSANGRPDSADSRKVPVGNVGGLTSCEKSVSILDWELIVVDGGSTDRTREIVRSYAEGEKADELGIRGRVRLLENREKLQSYGMNMGIREAHGEIICRADAHCIYPPEYVRRCVELLEMTKAANAGGTRIPRPAGPGKVRGAIALAVRHPMGVGDARFQLGNYTGEAEGAYYGTFWKKLFDEIGLYDPAASPNEDGELNLRIQKAGKTIYLDSSIEVVYFPRESLSALARQYFSYGKGRCYTSLKHRKMTSWRQAAPVVLAAGLVGSIAASLWQPMFLAFPAAYIAVLTFVALVWPVRAIQCVNGERLLRFALNDRKEGMVPEPSPRIPVRLLMAAAWMIMHTCWGLGFWKYLIFRRGRFSGRTVP